MGICLIFESSRSSSICESYYSASTEDSRAQKIHQEITETLFIGVPIKAEIFNANKNRNALWLVTLENPKTKKKIKALFKPREFGDGDGWNRPPMEYVSYEVSRMLGMDIIPPVAYRYNLTLNGNFFHEGSMQIFVPQALLLKDVDKAKWNLNADNFISNARVIDVLLQNPDRHKGNFIYGSHWIDGISRPALIDQAADLRKGTNMRLSTKGPFNDSLITHFDPITEKKLRQLNEAKLLTLIPFISKEEIAQILHHRDGIVQFIDSRSSDK